MALCSNFDQPELELPKTSGVAAEEAEEKVLSEQNFYFSPENDSSARKGQDFLEDDEDNDGDDDTGI